MIQRGIVSASLWKRFPSRWCPERLVSIRGHLIRAFVALLTAAAIAMGSLIQLVVLALLLLLLPERIGNRVIGPLLLFGPVLVGITSYAIYQRVMGQRRIRADAERWLAYRSRHSAQRRTRKLLAPQMGVWIPTVLAGVVFLFLSESIGLATHMLNLRPAKLIGYEVSFPLTWIITGSSANGLQTWASAGAFDCRGPLRSGFQRYWPFNLRASAVDVITSTSGITSYRGSPGTPFSISSVLIGGQRAQCKEYVEWGDEKLRTVECTTPKNEISVSFFGDRSNLAAFYRSLEFVRKTR